MKKKNNIFAGLRVKHIAAIVIASGLMVWFSGLYSRNADNSIKAEQAKELQKQQEIAAVREAETRAEAAIYAVPSAAAEAEKFQNRGDLLPSFNKNITAMRNRIGNLPAPKPAETLMSEEEAVQRILADMDAETKYYADYFRSIKPGRFVSDDEAIEELQGLYNEGRLPYQQAQRQR